MATLFVFNVLFHYELDGKRLAGTIDQHAPVATSSYPGDPAVVASILQSNGFSAPPGAVLVIDSVSNFGYGLT